MKYSVNIPELPPSNGIDGLSWLEAERASKSVKIALSALSGHQASQALQMVYGHQDFVERNTGLTLDARIQHFIQNPEGILSNNRHFIADTMAEYQPNGDATTEGQALHIIGYALMHMATGNQRFLDAAIHAWEAYIEFFYAGQPIPQSPQRYICNWLVNGKEPVLASYPVHPTEATLGGYKCVPLEFTNGRAKIPHGYPYWGEYLDMATYAHRGHMTWEAINASVQKIQEDVDGLINWQTVYDNHRKIGSEPWNSNNWIDWSAYLGAPSYTVQWGGAGSAAPEFNVSWLNTWAGTKIGIGKGPDDQLWSGEILETGVPVSDRGIIQLEDETINGVWLLNYSTKLPVEHGGYMFARNEPWHNRPVHAPFLASVNQMGNAADAEVWFIDACYLLWRITGDVRFKRALDCCFFTAHEYTFIDSRDKFFRQSKAASSPFTDGISYDFSFPEDLAIEYGRDSDGYITIQSPQSSQHFMEQQAVWFRLGGNSKVRVNIGAVGSSGEPVLCKVMLDVSPTKEETDKPTWYGLTLPAFDSMSVKTVDVPVGSLALMTNPQTDEDYMIADGRAATDYGGCVWSEEFESNVYDGRSATVIKALFPNDDAGFIIGFWLLAKEMALPKSIVYRADADFNARIEDADGWRWLWMLPATGTGWGRVSFDPIGAFLSGYQPNHPSSAPRPSSPRLGPVGQIVIILDRNTPNSSFSYYVVNDVPPLLLPDGWTMTYRMVFSCREPWAAKVGDCTIADFRLDSLAYCPGVIPFSNIYEHGSEEIGAWHGMPYPGYQYPMMYTIHKNNAKYSTWLNNQIAFLRDSQLAYRDQVGEYGPGCAAYVWNRWDNYKYGEADTWTTFHWGDGKPWAGYQPRAFQAAARTWYEMSVRGEQVPADLQIYVRVWIRWLVDFAREFGGHTPNEFPTAPDRPVWIPNDPTAHMIGLWLAGSCYAALAGCVMDGIDELIEYCVSELVGAFTVTEIPDKNINGAFSPAPRVSGDNGMAFGFYTGEIFRGLALYLMLRQNGPFDMYASTAIPDHTAASIDQ